MKTTEFLKKEKSDFDFLENQVTRLTKDYKKKKKTIHLAIFGLYFVGPSLAIFVVLQILKAKFCRF